jgi:ABC-2 type transport system ATP-binding protein
MTIFLTSHVLEVVERLVTHVGIIHRGRLVLQGTLDEVRAAGTLEETFIRAVGEERNDRQPLSWLAPGAAPAEPGPK